MAQEIERRLVGGIWRTVVVNDEGGGGISEITSQDNTVTITDPNGPTVDLSASGGSQSWEAVTVPTDAPSWIELGGGSGNWDFTDGVITFTNAGSGDSPVIVTAVDHFGQSWAVEAEVKVPDHTSYQFAFNAGAYLYQAAIVQELDGSGFQATSDPRIDVDLYNNTKACAVGLGDENWHTIRAVNVPIYQQIFFDGVLVGQCGSQQPNASQDDGLKESRFLLYDAIGGTSFRNLKAWRIPLPTFP